MGFENTSTNELNERMRKAVAAAKKAHAHAIEMAEYANELLKEIKNRKVGVVEYIDAANPALGTADVVGYKADGGSILNLARIGRPCPNAPHAD